MCERTVHWMKSEAFGQPLVDREDSLCYGKRLKLVFLVFNQSQVS